MATLIPYTLCTPWPVAKLASAAQSGRNSLYRLKSDVNLITNGVYALREQSPAGLAIVAATDVPVFDMGGAGAIAEWVKAPDGFLPLLPVAATSDKKWVLATTPDYSTPVVLTAGTVLGLARLGVQPRIIKGGDPARVLLVEVAAGIERPVGCMVCAKFIPEVFAGWEECGLGVWPDKAPEKRAPRAVKANPAEEARRAVVALIREAAGELPDKAEFEKNAGYRLNLRGKDAARIVWRRPSGKTTYYLNHKEGAHALAERLLKLKKDSIQ